MTRRQTFQCLWCAITPWRTVKTVKIGDGGRIRGEVFDTDVVIEFEGDNNIVSGCTFHGDVRLRGIGDDACVVVDRCTYLGREIRPSDSLQGDDAGAKRCRTERS